MQVYSVSEFVHGVNELLSGIPACVQGEVSNFHIAQNRFVWFDLKDKSSYVSCFLLAFQLDQPLEDGMEIQVIGRPALFQKSGKFHLRVNKIQVVGAGSLKRQYELLKAKLTKEGLFNEARKRPLPHFPKRVGIITSPDAAAYTDVLRILKNRWAGLEIRLFPVMVQGAQAVPSIGAALNLINRDYVKKLDVVILTRGGGSMEDLQAFNDEAVVRAVFGLKIPIVAAIGHERDQTLVELAEMIVPDKRDVIAQLATAVGRQYQALQNTHHIVTERITSDIVVLSQQMRRYSSTVDHLVALLHSYNPKQILQRGYSIMRTSTGRVVTHKKQVQSGETVHTIVVDGSINSKVL